MYLPNIELEIKGSLIGIKELKQNEVLKDKVPFWIRNKKLPYADDQHAKDVMKLNQKGMQPAFVSNFYLERLMADSYDVLGAIVMGDLANQVTGMVNKDCYLLPKPYPNLPIEIKEKVFIFIPPAAYLSTPTDKTISGIEMIESTFTDYNERLGEYYMLLPKNFLTDKKISKTRNLILSKTSYALILKYKSYFNAVLLKISNKGEPKANIPCKIFTEPDSKGFKPTEAYRLYFKHLAAEFSKQEYDTKWFLTTDNLKTVILPHNNNQKTIGEYITITSFSRLKQDNDQKTISVNSKEEITYIGKNGILIKTVPENILTNKETQSNHIKGTVQPYNKIECNKNDLVIKARAPLRFTIPPENAQAVLLPNHYYIVKLNPKMQILDHVKLMLQIKSSIKSFYDEHKMEIDSLGTIGFDLLRQIPLMGE